LQYKLNLISIVNYVTDGCFTMFMKPCYCLFRLPVLVLVLVSRELGLGTAGLDYKSRPYIPYPQKVKEMPQTMELWMTGTAVNKVLTVYNFDVFC